MKTCCFIIPYFGHLPNYFQLFLNSCRTNPSYNWILFTDDRRSFDFPKNFKVVYIAFQEVQNLVKEKIGSFAVLDAPYKLCDYKPTYGYIFEDYLSGYNYWGHCDIDTIFGNLNHFLPRLMQQEYDKIFCLGHLSLYRNSREVNTAFRLKYKNQDLMKRALSTPKIMYFDEEFNGDLNINHILSSNNFKIYTQDLSLNFSIFYNDFRRVRFYWLRNPNYVTEERNESLVVWNKGELFRYKVLNGELVVEEYPYVHLQSRKMKIKVDSSTDVMKIVPNSFRYLEHNILTVNDFNLVRKHYFCYHRLYLKYISYKKRILNKIRMKFKFIYNG